MGIEPVTAGLIGACLMACWPCLIPCCLSLALLPLPIIIVRNASSCPKCPKVCKPGAKNAYWHKFCGTTYQPCPDGAIYTIHCTSNGVKWTKLDKPSIVTN